MTAFWYKNIDFVETYAATNENYPKLKARLERMLADIKGEYVLDLGCGHGRDTRLMTEMGCKAVGLDYSETMLHKAKVLDMAHGLNIHYVVADMRQIGEIFVADTFSAAWCTASLIHIPVEDMAGVMEGLRKVTKPGSLVYVGLKGGETGTRLITENKYGREITREFSLWRAEDFEELALEMGFFVACFDRELSGLTGGKPTEWLNFELRNEK